MSILLLPSKGFVHPEEAPEGPSRRTHDPSHYGIRPVEGEGYE
jgi:hypothetical protein